jgi:hypothetical protein
VTVVADTGLAKKLNRPLSVKRFTVINIRNLFIVALLILILTIGYSLLILSSILNKLFAPAELNYKNAFIPSNFAVSDGKGSITLPEYGISPVSPGMDPNGSNMINQVQINGSGKTGGVSTYDAGSQNISNYRDSYRQNQIYKFTITPTSVTDLNLSYKTTIYTDNDGIKVPMSSPTVTHKYVLLDTGSTYILAKVEPELDAVPGQKYIGVLVPIDQSTINDIQDTSGYDFKLDKNLFGYQLDTITDFSDIEYYDMVLFYALTFIFILLTALAVFFKTNPKRHPTYRQFYKIYGDASANEKEIDSELADMVNVTHKGKTYRTKNWIIQKSFLKTKIARPIKP